MNIIKEFQKIKREYLNKKQEKYASYVFEKLNEMNADIELQNDY